MGYFSNGTEGMIYEEQYCSRCIHRDGPDGKTGCHVWLAHLLHSYKECNNPDSILDLLIPRSKDKLSNEQCKLFVESDAVERRQLFARQFAAGTPEHLKEWAGKNGLTVQQR